MAEYRGRFGIVDCEIHVESAGSGSGGPMLIATAYRLIDHALQEEGGPDGKALRFRGASVDDARARAEAMLIRRYGPGSSSAAPELKSPLRLLPPRPLPPEIEIAGYGEHGCPICQIGYPDDEDFEAWIQHCRQEHGYEVVDDSPATAPGALEDVDRLYRRVRLRRAK